MRSDGRRQKIIYSFTNGNENDAFEINSSNGQIRVRNSTALDYEVNPKLHLTLVAQTDNSTGSSLFAFADLTVYLTDQNDNAPVFTQEEYFASVLEGVNKGTFVIQVNKVLNVVHILAFNIKSTSNSTSQNELVKKILRTEWKYP